jgi:hypothetical protein
MQIAISQRPQPHSLAMSSERSSTLHYAMDISAQEMLETQVESTFSSTLHFYGVTGLEREPSSSSAEGIATTTTTATPASVHHVE